MRLILPIMVVLLTALGGCRSYPAPRDMTTASDAKILDALDPLAPPLSLNGWESHDHYHSAARAELARRWGGEWNERTRERVAREQIATGMPRRAVLASWGPPWRHAAENSPWGRVDRWYYGFDGRGTSVTFRNDVVIWWHEDDPD
jgi:hypothetical protein